MEASTDSRDENARDGDERYKYRELATATLIGLSTITVIQLLQVTSLDLPLCVSLYAFALAIPLLTIYFLIGVHVIYLRRTRPVPSPFPLPGRWANIVATIGMAAALIGMHAIFFHFSTSIGLVFLFSGIAALIFFYTRWIRAHMLNVPTSKPTCST